MKTILWAALTANGNYAQSGPDHPPKPQALADFAAQATAVGNFIVGRRTFEAFQAGGGGNTGGGGPFAALDIVVVSRSCRASRASPSWPPPRTRCATSAPRAIRPR